MGRKRRSVYAGYSNFDRNKYGYTATSYNLPRKLPSNSQQLELFFFEHDTPVTDQMAQLELVGFGADGFTIENDKVIRAAESFQASAVGNREYSKEYIVEGTAFDLGLTPRKAENAINRQERARAQAIQIAAKAGGVKLSAYQNRVLNAAAEGKYTEFVWGEKGQYEQGTIVTRMKATRRSGGINSNDESQRARAMAQKQQFLRYSTRAGDRDFRYA